MSCHWHLNDYIYLSIYPSIDALHNLMLSVLFAVHRFAIAIFFRNFLPGMWALSGNSVGRSQLRMYKGRRHNILNTIIWGRAYFVHQPFVDWFGAARLTWTSMRALPSFGVFWWAFQLKQGEPAMAIATPKKTEK